MLAFGATRFSSKQIFILGLLLFGFLIRLSLFRSIHDDILSNAGWGEWIAKNGPTGFYENQVWTFSWPTQPPLVNLLYGFCWHLYLQIKTGLTTITTTIALYRLAPTYFIWLFDFVKNFNKIVSPQVPFPIGFIYTIKLFPLIADILITYLLYRFSKKAIYPLLYWCLPFSFYLSAAWGQYDQISYLFLVLSFLSLKKHPISSCLLLFVSLNLKPTGLLFAPFYLYLLVLYRTSFKKTILAFTITLALTSKLISTFTLTPAFSYTLNTLYPKIFLKSEPRLSTNSLNFWHIFTGDKAYNHAKKILYTPAYLYGLTSYLLLFILVLRSKQNKHDNKYIFFGLSILGIGGWIFMTNMLERYLFTGLVSLLFLSIKKPKLLSFYLILSSIFFLNLYKSWWYPSIFFYLKKVLQLPHFTQLLALVNTIVFLKLFRNLNK